MGQTDMPLNAHGLEQADQAVEALKTFDIDAIYSSSLQRCRQTTDLLSKKLKLPVTGIDDLKERHWGTLEGKHKSERDPTKNPLDGETHIEFEHRVARTIKAVGTSVGRPLIVTHSGVIKVVWKTYCQSPLQAPIPHVCPIEITL